MFVPYLGYMAKGLRGLELLQGTNALDGLMFEGFILKTSGNEPHHPRSRVVQHLRDFEYITNDLGKKAYATNYFWLPDNCDVACGGMDALRADQLRQYGTATFMLVNNSHAYEYLVGLNAADSYAQYFPEFDARIGYPMSQYCGATMTARFCDNTKNGLLTRMFTHGLVIANPDYWGDEYENAEGPQMRTFILPKHSSCVTAGNCRYTLLRFTGGGSIHGDASSAIESVATYNVGDTVLLPRNSGMIFQLAQ